MILQTKYLSRNDHALQMFVLSVELSLIYLIGDPDVWEKKLADQFQKKISANKLALRKRWYSLILKGDC